MNRPDYQDMRRQMLDRIEECCTKCGDRFFDADGKMQCRRPDCTLHGVRNLAHEMNVYAFKNTR